MKLGRSKIVFYDYLALWADKIGNWLQGPSLPFFRLSRWASERYFRERRRG